MASWLFFLGHVVSPFLYPLIDVFFIYSVSSIFLLPYLFHILFFVSSFSVTNMVFSIFLSIFDYKGMEGWNCAKLHPV